MHNNSLISRTKCLTSAFFLRLSSSHWDSYLSGGLDSLPYAEEADDPDDQQTQGQVPFHWTQVVYAGADG